MNRIAQLDPIQATEKTKQLFERLQMKFGFVPNLFSILAVSPGALEGYLTFGEALTGGSLNFKIREQIALVVAECNLCSYCLNLHSLIAAEVGLTEKEITNARHSNATTEKTDAILKLARSIVVQRGEINDADLERTRACGVSDRDIVETVANIALNIFTNYVNLIARTVVDFPEGNSGDDEAPVGIVQHD
jgi:uncharacterized peroxidase-related enzyme